MQNAYLIETDAKGNLYDAEQSVLASWRSYARDYYFPWEQRIVLYENNSTSSDKLNSYDEIVRDIHQGHDIMQRLVTLQMTLPPDSSWKGYYEGLKSTVRRDQNILERLAKLCKSPELPTDGIVDRAGKYRQWLLSGEDGSVPREWRSVRPGDRLRMLYILRTYGKWVREQGISEPQGFYDVHHNISPDKWLQLHERDYERWWNGLSHASRWMMWHKKSKNIHRFYL